MSSRRSRRIMGGGAPRSHGHRRKGRRKGKPSRAHAASRASSSTSSGSSSSSSSSSYSSSSDSSSEFHERLRFLRKKNPEHSHHDRSFYKKSKWLRAMTKTETTRKIQYVDLHKISGHAFRKKFEHQSIPCMITGATKGWKARKNWTKKGLVRKYGDAYFNVSGKPLKMKHYLRYCEKQKDDSPLYLFQDALERSGRQGMIDDFTVPSVFKYDLFGVIPNEQRPPYRWMVIGPKRSGTHIHQDPLGTSAWNTLTSGTKLWVLFPPHIPKKKFMMKHKFKTDHDEAIDWFRDCFPSALRHQDELEMIVCVQREGDTIFVPGDWWHGVLNINFTVAITQNFASLDNVRRVYARTKKERARLSKRWMKLLAYTEPQVAIKLKEFESDRSLSTGSRWSDSASGWSDVDDLDTLSTSDIGKYDLVIDHLTSRSEISSSAHSLPDPAPTVPHF